MISEECNAACCTLNFLNTTYSGLTKDYGSKTVVVDTRCCRSLPRFSKTNRDLLTYQTSCRGR